MEDVFCLDFVVSESVYGETKSIPLKVGGDKIPVTQENKQEYVTLYCDYILNKSCDKQYQAFHQGFHKVCRKKNKKCRLKENPNVFFQVCGGRVLDLFHARELMTLVVGKEVYDWEELEKTAEYKVGNIFLDGIHFP